MGDMYDNIEQILKDYVKKADLRKLVEEMKPYHDNSCICERCEWHEELSDKIDKLLEVG